MWAIINKKNILNTIHTHPINFLSSSYYVKAPTNAGSIKFLNKNSVAKETFQK